jgi:hypothetical protein
VKHQLHLSTATPAAEVLLLTAACPKAERLLGPCQTHSLARMIAAASAAAAGALLHQRAWWMVLQLLLLLLLPGLPPPGWCQRYVRPWRNFWYSNSNSSSKLANRVQD